MFLRFSLFGADSAGKSAKRADRRRESRLRRRWRRVFLEQLEDRRLLANVLWIASTASTWNTVGNWIDLSDGTARLPASSDVAVFDTTQHYGSTFGTNANATIDAPCDVAGISLASYTGHVTQTAGMSLTVGASGFSQASGTFTANDSILVSDSFSLSGGTLTAPPSGKTFAVSGNFAVASGSTFTHNAGTVTFDASAGTQTFNSGGKPFNAITHSGAGTLQLVSNTLTTNSTFTNSAGTFDINGRTANLATLRLTGGLVKDTTAVGSITSSGNYDVRAGAISAILTGTASMLKTTSGTVTLSGGNGFSGGLTIQSGTVPLVVFSMLAVPVKIALIAPARTS